MCLDLQLQLEVSTPTKLPDTAAALQTASELSAYVQTPNKHNLQPAIMTHESQPSLLWLFKSRRLKTQKDRNSYDNVNEAPVLHRLAGLHRWFSRKTNGRKTRGSSMPNSKLSCCLKVGISLNATADSTIKELLWLSRASNSWDILFIPGRAAVFQHAAYNNNFLYCSGSSLMVPIQESLSLTCSLGLCEWHHVDPPSDFTTPLILTRTGARNSQSEQLCELVNTLTLTKLTNLMPVCFAFSFSGKLWHSLLIFWCRTFSQRQRLLQVLIGLKKITIVKKGLPYFWPSAWFLLWLLPDFL